MARVPLFTLETNTRIGRGLVLEIIGRGLQVAKESKGDLVADSVGTVTLSEKVDRIELGSLEPSSDADQRNKGSLAGRNVGVTICHSKADGRFKP